MNKMQLLLGVHNHQPIDNFSHVVDKAVATCYEPFFRTLEKYENIRISVHFSGWLLEYIYKNSRELFAILKKLHSEGRIEIFGGGYYEPILASIPSEDRVGQIKLLNKFLKRHFGVTPKGIWLAERVWDSSIIKDLEECGIEYVLVDDFHFISAGIGSEALDGYYVAEDGGARVNVFPISKELRYMIPFRGAGSVVEHLEAQSQNGKKSAIIFDDGEKFGVWPNTYDWVYNQGWLEQFFEKLSASQSVESALYADYVRTHKALGLAYLPLNSYYEMGEWTHRSNDAPAYEKLFRKLEGEHGYEYAVKFLRGGIWKNFFTKYYESNHIHKRLVEISLAKKELKRKDYYFPLYKSQANDVLWHGVFGGLYLPNLRNNTYKYIYECENMRYLGKKDSVEVCDFNYDGFDDVKVVNSAFIAYFDTKHGCMMSELGLRDKLFNMQNTLKRTKEAYHIKVEDVIEHKESATEGDGISTIHTSNTAELAAMKREFVFDRFQKQSFIDHIVDYSFCFESFRGDTYKEYGTFCNDAYTIQNVGERGFEAVSDGRIVGEHESFGAYLVKKIDFNGKSIDFAVTLNSECHYDLQYFCEFNLYFADVHALKITGVNIEQAENLGVLEQLEIYDPYLDKKTHFAFAQPIECFCTPIDTVTQSESGFEKTNQGISLCFKIGYKYSFNFGGSLTIG